jgi:hypothetical protein
MMINNQHSSAANSTNVSVTQLPPQRNRGDQCQSAKTPVLPASKNGAMGNGTYKTPTKTSKNHNAKSVGSSRENYPAATVSMK